MQKIKFFNWLFLFIIVAAGAGLAFVIFTLDPNASTSNLTAFYLLVFLLIWAIAYLAGANLRLWLGSREFAYYYHVVSLRQGFWLGMLAVVLLLLQAIGLFSIINAAFLILSITFLEFYFVYKTNDDNRS